MLHRHSYTEAGPQELHSPYISPPSCTCTKPSPEAWWSSSLESIQSSTVSNHRCSNNSAPACVAKGEKSLLSLSASFVLMSSPRKVEPVCFVQILRKGLWGLSLHNTMSSKRFRISFGKDDIHWRARHGLFCCTFCNDLGGIMIGCQGVR